MSFLAPLMLLGAAAGSIPIILHFFYRSRYRKVPWAAMRFLRTSIEQTSRRLRFQEILLLIVRVTALVLLALALARPFTRTLAGDGSSRGDAVDAVFVIDVSYSMAARDGPVNRLDRARTAALAVIDHLPRNSTVQIIGCADRSALLGPKTPSNLGQARQILGDMKPTSLATDLLPGVMEAAEALRRGQAPNRELYLFSDMQAGGWEQQGENLTEHLRRLSRQANIYLVRCGTRAPRNAAITGIAPQSGIPHTGDRVGFAVLVRNSGQEPIRDLTLSLEVDGQSQQKDAVPIPLLNPGETKALTLTGKLDRPGLRVITARLMQDDVEPDNRFDQVIHVREQVRVLVIDGNPNERDPEKASSYYLLHSLRPVAEPAWGKYHIQPRTVAPSQAVPALLADKDAVILVNVPLDPRSGGEGGVLSAEFIDRLAEFVREGHGLLIFAGPRTFPESYNRLLVERHRLLPARFNNLFTASHDKPLGLDPNSADTADLLAGFREEPLDRISLVEVDRLMTVEAPSSSAEEKERTRTVLRYTDGKPAVLARRAGDGEVVLVTTSADTSWTNWPILPTYLPFSHVTLSHLLHEQTQGHNRTAGEVLRYHPSLRQAVTSFTLIKPSSERVRLGPPDTSKGRPAVAVSDTWTAGIYRLAAGEDLSAADQEARPTDAVPFAVVPDLRESENLESLSDAQLDERLGFKPVHLTAGDDTSVFSGSERLNWEWTKYLLVALLCLVLGESLLAWFCGRSW